MSASHRKQDPLDKHVYRALEGVLTYVNAFMLLDLARSQFAEHELLGVIIVGIITLIIFWYMRSRIGKTDVFDMQDRAAWNAPPDPAQEHMRARMSLGTVAWSK